MKSTYMKKLMSVCGNANLDYRLKAKGLLVEGDDTSNHRIMKLRYLDALLDLARERFARNFTKAIDGCMDAGITGKSNNKEKIYALKFYLESRGLEIHPFMMNVMMQAVIVYERGACTDVFNEDELNYALYLECSPEWVLYGIEELFYRFLNDEFVDVHYFDDAKCLIPDVDFDEAEKQRVWGLFAMYILAILDDSASMQIPEYNHELDEDFKPSESEKSNTSEKNGLTKTIEQALETIKNAFKR